LVGTATLGRVEGDKLDGEAVPFAYEPLVHMQLRDTLDDLGQQLAHLGVELTGRPAGRLWHAVGCIDALYELCEEVQALEES
jgi:hypothetical protein